MERLNRMIPNGGSENYKVLVVVDPPPKNAQGYMTSEALKQFANYVKPLGFTRDDFYFVAASPHIPDELYSSASKRAKFLKNYREAFLKQITSLKNKPKIILCMGAIPASQVKGRSVKITQARGQIDTVSTFGEAIPTLSVFSMGYVNRSPQHEPVLVSDLNMLKKFKDADWSSVIFEQKLQTADKQYNWVLDLKFLLDMKPKALYVDTETTGLEWHNPNHYPFMAQFCWEPGKAVAVPLCKRFWPSLGDETLNKILGQLGVILEDPNIKKAGHNFKFDYLMFKHKLDIEVAGWINDTQIMAHAVDENMYTFTQAECVRRWVPAMAGYCVCPNTKILTNQMKWVDADTLNIGDELLGFEEYGEFKKRRKIQKSIIQDIAWTNKLSYRIELQSGRSITVSHDHKLLQVRKNHNGGLTKWATPVELKVGDRLSIFPYKTYQDTYESGYMAGILDGEGWVQGTDTQSFRVGFAQNSGEVLDYCLELLNQWGIEYSLVSSNKNDTVNVYVNGWAAYELLQITRPTRLLSKTKWENRSVPSGRQRQRDDIVSITEMGKQDLLFIKTSTSTFIAEGICSHNSDRFDKTVDKSNMINVPKDQLLEYGCGDVDSGFRLAGVLKTLILKGDGGQAHWNVVQRVKIPALQAFADTLETNGVPISTDNLQDLEVSLQETANTLHRDLLTMVPPVVRYRHAKAGLSFTRSAFVRDILFSKDGFNLKPRVCTNTTKKLSDAEKVPSVSTKDHLPYFERDNEFVRKYIEYSKVNKLLSTYVGTQEKNSGFWKHIRTVSINVSKVYPSYLLHRANTGRTASEKPNGQNFPKHSDYAKLYLDCFVADMGWSFVACDYSQAELRGIAWHSGDEAMQKVYREGGDLHINTALHVVRCSLDQFLQLDPKMQKEYRRQAKPVNFGVAYGVTAESLVDFAYTMYKVVITLEQSRMLMDALFRAYPTLKPWQEAMIEHAKRYGHVRSLHGVVRHLPDIYSKAWVMQSAAERNAINSPIQGFASDWGLMALVRLRRDIKAANIDWIKPCMYIHDSLVCLVRNDHIAEGPGIIKHYLESNPFQQWFGITPPIPIAADVEHGVSLGSMVELQNVEAIRPEWTQDD